MIQRMIDLPTLGLIAGTRVALGVGAGLLLSERMTADARRACGLALLSVGILSTIPLALEFWSSKNAAEEETTRPPRRLRTASHA